MGWIKALLAALLLIAALVIGLCFGLYAIGASRFPDDLEPNGYRAPPGVRALYLDVEVGDIDDVPHLDPVSIWGYGLRHLSDTQREPLGAQLRLLGHAGRSLVIRQSSPAGPMRRHLANLAATVHVSRHWEMDRMVDTLLAEGWFGRNARGIEQAANVWYGRPLADLAPEERLLLIALVRSPSYYDPACHPERFAKRYRWAAAQADGFEPDAALHRAGTPVAADLSRRALTRRQAHASAQSDLRKSTSARRSSAFIASNRCFAAVPCPPCHSTASSSVAARPSCR